MIGRSLGSASIALDVVEELVLRRWALALFDAVDVERHINGARDSRWRPALAGLDLRWISDVENDWVLEISEDLGVRDGPGPSAPAYEIGRKPDREQAARASRLRRESGKGTDDTHGSCAQSEKLKEE